MDLAEILGVDQVSRNRLAAVLISELIETFVRFQHGGFADWAAEWATFDHVIGRQVRLQLPNTVVIGTARGVNTAGALLLESADGRITPYIGGEIGLRIEP